MITRAIHRQSQHRAVAVAKSPSRLPRLFFKSQDATPFDQACAEKLAMARHVLTGIANAGGYRIEEGEWPAIDQVNHVVYFNRLHAEQMPLEDFLALFDHEGSHALYTFLDIPLDPNNPQSLTIRQDMEQREATAPGLFSAWNGLTEDGRIENLAFARGMGSRLKGLRERIFSGSYDALFLRSMLGDLKVGTPLTDEDVRPILEKLNRNNPYQEYMRAAQYYTFTGGKIWPGLKLRQARKVLDATKDALLRATGIPRETATRGDLLQAEKEAAMRDSYLILRDEIYPRVQALLEETAKDLSKQMAKAIKRNGGSVAPKGSGQAQAQKALQRQAQTTPDPTQKPGAEPKEGTIGPRPLTPEDLTAIEEMMQAGGKIGNRSPGAGSTIVRPKLEKKSEGEPTTNEAQGTLSGSVLQRNVDPGDEFARALEEALAKARAQQIDARVAAKKLDDAVVSQQDAWGKFALGCGGLAHQLRTALGEILRREEEMALEGPFHSGTRLSSRRILPFVTSKYEDARLFYRWQPGQPRIRHFALLMDASGSMTESASPIKSLNQQKAGFVLTEALSGLPNTFISIVKAKNNAAFPLLTLADRLTRAEKNKLIQQIKPDGYANGDLQSLDWAIATEIEFQRRYPGGQSFYLPVTDGQGNGWDAESLQLLHDKLKTLRDLRAEVFALGIGEEMDTTEVYGEHAKLAAINLLPQAISRYVLKKIEGEVP